MIKRENDIMQTKDLNKVYSLFNPMKPLTGHQLKDYYIDREKNPIQSLKDCLLRELEEYDKILFTGHRGCGKSTELNRLREDEDLNKNYFIVHYSAEDVLDILDLNYIDLLFSIESMIYQYARAEGIEFDNDLLSSLSKFWIPKASEIKGFIEREEERKPQEILDKFYRELVSEKGRLKLEPFTRGYLREKMSPMVVEIIGHINSFSTIIRKETKKNILVIIDGLDKPDLKIAYELFYNRATSITQPSCKIIYTIPIALLYQAEFRGIERNFHSKFILPNVKIQHRNGSLYEKGYETLRYVVLKRISNDLIEDNALNLLISKSGGVIRELTLLMRTACDIAIVNGKDKIDLVSSQQAVNAIKNDYHRVLRKEHYQELIKIHNTKDICELVFPELLHNLSILEYSNDENWWNVHPIVLELIEESNEGE